MGRLPAMVVGFFVLIPSGYIEEQAARKGAPDSPYVDPFDQLEYLPDKPRRGRPTLYTEELGLRIIEHLAENRPLRWIGVQPDMPVVTTIIRWRNDIPEFKALYEEARLVQLELIADDILEISDHGQNEVGRDKLRTDNRKWLLSKLSRHVYGNTVKLEVAQAKPDTDLDLTKLSEEQFQQYLELLEKAKADGDAD